MIKSQGLSVLLDPIAYIDKQFVKLTAKSWNELSLPGTFQNDYNKRNEKKRQCFSRKHQNFI